MHSTNHEGQVVLVTGASTGIGRALALRLGRAGAHLGLLARGAERLDALKAELGPDVQALTLVADVTDPEATRAAVDRLAGHFGRLDLAIANAGASMNARFEAAELEVFHRMMDVNYFGALHTARFARPHLEASGGGLMFVSSILGKRGMATRSGYAAAKFAVHGLFESLRAEWADSGIHVGLVAPGYTETEIRFNALGPDGQPRRERGVTRGRVMSADDAAKAIVTAAARRRREVVLTAPGKFMVQLNRFFPALADRVAARATA